MNFTDLQDGFIARKLTIASVFPIKCVETRPFGRTMAGGITKYELEAAEKGKWTTCTVWDAWERKMSDQGSVGSPMFEPSPVSAQSIVNDLLTHWVEKRMGTAQGHRPGIMLIAADEPTAEELAYMHGRQKPYLDGLVHEANGFAAAHKWKDINELHRMAARVLGIDAANAKWVADLGSQQEWKECVYCVEKIPAKASVCRVCHEKQPGFKLIDEAQEVIVVEPVLTLAQRAAQARAKQPVPANA